jgi:hypothetical protein
LNRSHRNGKAFKAEAFTQSAYRNFGCTNCAPITINTAGTSCLPLLKERVHMIAKWFSGGINNLDDLNKADDAKAAAGKK